MTSLAGSYVSGYRLESVVAPYDLEAVTNMIGLIASKFDLCRATTLQLKFDSLSG